MRSRYAAYAVGEIEYLVRTIPLTERKGFDRRSAKEWSQSAEWLGLEILSTKDNLDGKRATVEFAASFKQGDQTFRHHEISRFERIQDRWFYLDGEVVPENLEPAEAISRNAPCPCGSGKKFKRCCGGK
jgi:SEC-C motif-containing protein